MLCDLTDLPVDMFNSEMYADNSQSPALWDFQNKYFIDSDKFWFVTPEYNGSFPGSLKLLIDAMSIRDAKKTFDAKKACLTGVASGRAGNLRGMDHLNDVLNHLGIHVMPLKLPISQISNLLDEDNKIIDKETIKALDDQLDRFINF